MDAQSTDISVPVERDRQNYHRIEREVISRGKPDRSCGFRAVKV